MYMDAVKILHVSSGLKSFKIMTDISDNTRSGKRTDQNEKLSEETFELDPCQSIKEMAEKVPESYSTVHIYLKLIGENIKRGNEGSSY